MKKKVLSLALALALCLGLTISAGAYDMGTAGQKNIISCGFDHTAVIDGNGFLWMWGNNDCGQLGNGSKKDSLVPVKVMDKVAAVNCGDGYTAAIRTDGSLWMWGYNEHGQLGNGTTEDSFVPVRVMDKVAAVSCGYYCTAIIKTDGSLWMWGYNSGRLGNGTYEDSHVPVKVMDNVAAVCSGSWNTAAIKTDGSLWMWGGNDWGDLGNGSVQQRSLTPAKVMDNVVAVCCGVGVTAAIKTDGSLWMWGGNEFGQLGNGGKGNAKNKRGDTIQTVPTKVMDGVAAVDCGDYSTAAIKTDGSFWTWGCNSKGQLGNGGKGNAKDINGRPIQTVPVKVMNSVATVTCGSGHTAAVKTDGSLWMWGENEYGQLGIGGGGNAKDSNGDPIQTVPVQIKGLTLSVSKTPAGKNETASPTNDKLTVNGAAADPTVYKIGGSNYFKIRDVAALLNGTEKQFAVGYDSALKSVTATTGQGYAKLDTDLTGAPAGGSQTASPSNDAIYVNGQKIDAEVYKIGGSNYFKLRDLGKALDFYVGWSKDRGMYIETDKGYTE